MSFYKDFEAWLAGAGMGLCGTAPKIVFGFLIASARRLFTQQGND